MDMNDEYYMNIALEEAKKAIIYDEVPVGSVMVYNNQIVSRTFNRKNLDKIATYHAEIIAIEETCRKLNTWYLDDCTLYTTVEPCMMCTGAIIQARIKRVVYGTKNEAFGYLSKLENTKVQITSGILKEECTKVMSDFFKEKRV